MALINKLQARKQLQPSLSLPISPSLSLSLGLSLWQKKKWVNAQPQRLFVFIVDCIYNCVCFSTHICCCLSVSFCVVVVLSLSVVVAALFVY